MRFLHLMTTGSPRVPHLRAGTPVLPREQAVAKARGGCQNPWPQRCHESDLGSQLITSRHSGLDDCDVQWPSLKPTLRPTPCPCARGDNSTPDFAPSPSPFISAGNHETSNGPLPGSFSFRELFQMTQRTVKGKRDTKSPTTQSMLNILLSNEPALLLRP